MFKQNAFFQFLRDSDINETICIDVWIFESSRIQGIIEITRHTKSGVMKLYSLLLETIIQYTIIPNVL